MKVILLIIMSLSAALSDRNAIRLAQVLAKGRRMIYDLRLENVAKEVLTSCPNTIPDVYIVIPKYFPNKTNEKSVTEMLKLISLDDEFSEKIVNTNNGKVQIKDLIKELGNEMSHIGCTLPTTLDCNFDKTNDTSYDVELYNSLLYYVTLPIISINPNFGNINYSALENIEIMLCALSNSSIIFTPFITLFVAFFYLS